MNRVAPSVPLGGDIDDLLGAFFKSEMPSPWPELEPPAQARTLAFKRRPAPRRRRPLFASRLALVASVALLMCAAWLLGGRASTSVQGDRPGRRGQGEASRNNLRPVGLPTHQETKKDGPALPKAEPVPDETIEVDKGTARLKLTFPRMIPNK